MSKSNLVIVKICEAKFTWEKNKRSDLENICY